MSDTDDAGAGRPSGHADGELLRKAVDATLDRARPRVVRRGEEAYFLIEGGRRRAVAPRVALALGRTIGPVDEASESELDALTVGAQVAVSLATPSTIGALLGHATLDSTIAIAGRDGGDVPADRRTERLSVHHPGIAGARLLDRVALAHARGVTHLIVPADEGAVLLERGQELADHLARRATIVATSDAGTMWKLPPAPPAGKPKVFGIGLNKTGTTSLHLACNMLGMRSFHWGDRHAYHAVLQAQRDGERLLQYVGEEYDAYSDLETLSMRFDIADVQYPGSRFVLTVRDVDGWVDSRRRHVERNRRDQLAGTYQGVNTRIDEDLWRRQWQTHVDRVHEWFAGRDNLLVLDIGAGDGWERLAPFLERPIPDVPFPRGNVDRRAERQPGASSRQADASPAEWLPTPAQTAKDVPAATRALAKRVTAAWRSVRCHLPSGVAEAIRSPSKRVLRRLGVMSGGRPHNGETRRPTGT